MIAYLLIVPVVLVAGYFIARYHHRFRDFGIGSALGTVAGSAAGPSLPSVSDVHGHADGDHPSISDGGDGHGAGDRAGDHDSTSTHGDADL